MNGLEKCSCLRHSNFRTDLKHNGRRPSFVHSAL